MAEEKEKKDPKLANVYYPTSKEEYPMCIKVLDNYSKEIEKEIANNEN